MYIAADQSRIMQDQMTGPAMGMPPDPSKAFKVCLVFNNYTVFVLLDSLLSTCEMPVLSVMCNILKVNFKFNCFFHYDAVR